MSKMSKKRRIEEEKKYYFGKVLCTADPSDPAHFLKYKFNHVFVIFGFTGSGKDTIINGFMNQNKKYPFVKFIRTLTRRKRPAELDMFDAFFVERELFDYLKEHSRFFYWYKKYGGKEFGYDTLHLIFELSKNNIFMIGGSEKNYLGLIDGIKSIYNRLPITTIFINRPKNDIITYIKKRGGDTKEVNRRIDFIKKNWYKTPKNKMDYFIWNTDIKKAVKEFISIIKSALEKK